MDDSIETDSEDDFDEFDLHCDLHWPLVRSNLIHLDHLIHFHPIHFVLVAADAVVAAVGAVVDGDDVSSID